MDRTGTTDYCEVVGYVSVYSAAEVLQIDQRLSATLHISV